MWYIYTFSTRLSLLDSVPSKEIFSNLGMDSNFACFTLFLISASWHPYQHFLSSRDCQFCLTLSISPCCISCESNLPVQAMLPAGGQFMLAIGICWYFNGLGLLINQINSSGFYAKGTQCKLYITLFIKSWLKEIHLWTKKQKLKLRELKGKDIEKE